jgi:hypothetical protein
VTWLAKVVALLPPVADSFALYRPYVGIYLIFLVVCVILCSSIKGFAMPNCRLFHTIEKNICIAVKNWWSLTYGHVSSFP